MTLEIILKDVDVNLGPKKILHRLNWRIESGEIHFVQGHNGSGKTTFLRLLAGHVWPTPETYNGRSYVVNGRKSHSPALVKEKIKMVCPEDYAFYAHNNLNLKVLDLVLSGINNTIYQYTRPKEEDIEKAIELLELFDLNGLKEKRFLTLSSGQAQRALIARALMGNPKLLLLDELGLNLDHKGRLKLFSILEQIVTQRSCAIVCTTHQAEEKPANIQYFWQIKNGQILAQTEQPPPKTSKPKHLSQPQKLLKSPLKEGKTPPAYAAIAIQLRNVSVQRKGEPVLKDIHFELKKGETWAILGPNGSGKSTFLRLLLGEIHPLPGGEIKWWGKSKTTLWELRQKIGFVSPELGAQLRPEMTVFELVASGLLGTIGICPELEEKEKLYVLDFLHKWEADTLAHMPIHTLSFGQARKALLLRALINNPEVLLLDEALTGLDEKERHLFLRTLIKAVNKGTNLVMTTHYPQEIQHFISKGIVLNQGRIVYQGTFKEALNAWLNQE
ncbi:ATP-binding cassette domain-containing protein [Desulfohalobiaceae bacterium Ax17]|uniref:ATP-binding cassette domain-containing protein n=1 Tax=Desulfovulcanus ferrireducens TaxID=2831190 RepID=UPI00207BB094|nr:ATP-binding cassette domain-containing protein [Desulfovulcanus ferrireducens]MBT8762626.1 ATP-binding cassette domain-containing protein [Desulfovulcanus ferrireducens]